MNMVLPGRMNELELLAVEVDFSFGRIVSFSFLLDGELVEVNFDIDKRVWWVFIDNGHFDNIPETVNLKVNHWDALKKLQLVLTEFEPKTASGIKALRNWRNKLQVWPAKLVALNK